MLSLSNINNCRKINDDAQSAHQRRLQNEQLFYQEQGGHQKRHQQQWIQQLSYDSKIAPGAAVNETVSGGGAGGGQHCSPLLQLSATPSYPLTGGSKLSSPPGLTSLSSLTSAMCSSPSTTPNNWLDRNQVVATAKSMLDVMCDVASTIDQVEVATAKSDIIIDTTSGRLLIKEAANDNEAKEEKEGQEQQSSSHQKTVSSSMVEVLVDRSCSSYLAKYQPPKETAPTTGGGTTVFVPPVLWSSSQQEDHDLPQAPPLLQLMSSTSATSPHEYHHHSMMMMPPTLPSMTVGQSQIYHPMMMQMMMAQQHQHQMAMIQQHPDWGGWIPNMVDLSIARMQHNQQPSTLNGAAAAAAAYNLGLQYFHQHQYNMAREIQQQQIFTEQHVHPNQNEYDTTKVDAEQHEQKLHKRHQSTDSTTSEANDESLPPLPPLKHHCNEGHEDNAVELYDIAIKSHTKTTKKRKIRNDIGPTIVHNPPITTYEQLLFLPSTSANNKRSYKRK